MSDETKEVARPETPKGEDSDLHMETTDGIGEGNVLMTNTTAADCADSFDDMGLSEELQRGIYGYGFEKPSPIQRRAVIPFKSGRDIIAQAQSGTGKTAAFTIGTLARIDVAMKAVQAILLSPTRELADQTYKVVHDISRFMEIKVVECIGGTSVEECAKQGLADRCRLPRAYPRHDQAQGDQHG